MVLWEENRSTRSRAVRSFSVKQFPTRSAPVTAEVVLGTVPVPGKFAKHGGEAAKRLEGRTPWKWNWGAQTQEFFT